jgi:heme exporter protein CcmD
MGEGGTALVSTGFWSMGGYARYVWPCFAFGCLVFGWNLWSARRYLAAARLRAARGLIMGTGVMAAGDSS